jgi:demethylmenaquinone methyltransferase/2-methoxy-6-polyprenyl-1,4-benzoquinol methylase
MLRPGNPALEKLYFAYLRMSLAFTGFVFHSSPAAMNCRRYFIRTLAMFYSADELSMVLDTLGFRDISTRTIFAGMIACHSAAKPPTA